MATTGSRNLLLAGTAVLAIALLAGSAFAAMRTDRISRNLCETTGGGRFVKIPGSPGERADKRILKDIKVLKRKYKIFITDGYSHDPVHAANGEHPLGLALDIVPDSSRGGTWRDITRLAKWAEPKQNQPRAPFRWVGYDGDAGHGRGDHLHLSWNHSDSRPFHPARTVYSLRCPGTKSGGGKDQDGSGSGGDKDRDSSGGTRPGGGNPSGGTSPRRALFRTQAAAPVVEAGGVGAP